MLVGQKRRKATQLKKCTVRRKMWRWVNSRVLFYNEFRRLSDVRKRNFLLGHFIGKEIDYTTKFGRSWAIQKMPRAYMDVGKDDEAWPFRSKRFNVWKCRASEFTNLLHFDGWRQIRLGFRVARLVVLPPNLVVFWSR